MTDKIREEIAQWLFYRDWDKEFTTGIYFSGDWQEGLEEADRDRYRKEADQILSIKVGNRTLKELIELQEKGKLLVRAENQKLPDNLY